MKAKSLIAITLALIVLFMISRQAPTLTVSAQQPVPASSQASDRRAAPQEQSEARMRAPPPTADSAARTRGPSRRVQADAGALMGAIRAQASDVLVEGEGTVVKLLPDDRDGSPHQRFIVRLASGDTLLIAHNIDLAGRLEPLVVGDRVSFGGEYVWNAKGGVIHWTHPDPEDRHPAGWLERIGDPLRP